MADRPVAPLAAFSVYKKLLAEQVRGVQKKKRKSRPNNLNATKNASSKKGSVNKPTKPIINGSGKIMKTKIKINERTMKKKHNNKKSTVSLNGKQSVAKTHLTSPKTEQAQSHPAQVFEWMTAPLKPSAFFKNHWEKRPLHIKRNREDYYKQLLTTEKLDTILRENVLFYTRNVDVVSYTNGVRETHNPDGRAVPAALWDYYGNKCSIRILNPQTYCNKLHSLLAALQEYFGCMAGVNAYLTPPDSQGFAPHYDDIEAFVLQLEGRKHWKLYAPRSEEEALPRFSSKNFDRKELKRPIKEITLEAGDLLYFPRGVIHEGRTDAGSHSFHITVSVYQRTAYIDLMEHMLKPALAAAVQNDIEFREGLPLQYLKHTGLANADSASDVRTEIISKVQKLFTKVINYISVDTAADEMGKQFMWDAMPPVPLKQERQCMAHADADRILNGKIQNKAVVDLDLKVRLLCYHCLRITTDEDSESNIRIYYSTDNAKFYHGEEQQFIVVDKSIAPAVQHLLQIYPNFIEIGSLPLDKDVDKMQIVSDLWERGLVVTDGPLQPLP